MATGIDFTARRGGVSRTAGGVLALAFPLAMTALALSVGLRRLGDMTDIAASLLATIMFLVAAPTAWIFTVDFIEAGRLMVITSALVTSLPLWFLAGSRLAYYARSWGIWAIRYVVLCVVWSALNIVLIVIVGSIAG